MPDDVGESEHAEVVVNRDGRVLIPAQVRRDLRLTPGSTLVLSVEDGRVVMESREQLMARIRREVAESWTGSADTSAADELIADRRAEAAAEDQQQ
ncbi:AbrB/MazE/SpoVT family DNA-binding domain-containing protein [Pseudonocardia sp. C8]|uniref:AbrB/MazE/SpoVT family DNA-binding domain-containing protein n=1 Tax=Pseudonocardia sp. C8 TaxID=2762759 RepID=UPI00164253AE|nr:AbrB/MazE/SpoVT family DNA-binding domain-containing protein [Pseudonocardia sp. C8]MBC3189508.1 AbrB/MazE/SpoVT family DNA-binding domain-containing protein [Pseudonocardia sp. C8]